MKFFVWAEQEEWGFQVVPVYCEMDELYLGKAVFVRRKKVAVHGRLTKNTLGHGGLHGVKVENGI